ncbi:MAG: FadR family transcriptional regulator [Labilithrix sp.]|nr:FadR family transcriptional regulator [Labilithrix sp.]MBX3224863.1 FadR family transcriptional regulator [Labilithrix sp.]
MTALVRKFEVVRREHAADRIFDQLAAAILKGELATGEALPPERALADDFGVSRTIVRQATHRLADLGLVRVKQGGATIVQDVVRATDPRVVELRYRIGPTTEKQRREIVERRMFEGYALVSLASYRAAPEAIQVLLARLQDFAARGAPEGEGEQLERDIWTALAEATDNELYIAQAAWWNKIVAERESEPTAGSIPAAFRVPFYTELLTRILERRDAPGFYVDTVRPLVLGPPPIK